MGTQETKSKEIRNNRCSSIDVTKHPYHSLDAIETEGNAEALRTARQSLCKADSTIMGRMRDIVDSEIGRIIGSETGIPEAEGIDERIRGLRMDLEAPGSREGLRCCPMCGNPLSWDGVYRFIDTDRVFATDGCRCGFSFASDASDSDDWKDLREGVQQGDRLRPPGDTRIDPDLPVLTHPILCRSRSKGIVPAPFRSDARARRR